MKQHIITAALLLLTPVTFAVTGPKYCELSVYQAYFKRYVADVNYMGSHKKRFDKIKNDGGKRIKFECRLDAVNYMINNGWEVVSSDYLRGGEARYYMKKKGALLFPDLSN